MKSHIMTTRQDKKRRTPPPPEDTFLALYSATEYEYFLKNLSRNERRKVRRIEEHFTNHARTDIPYRFQIILNTMPMSVKMRALEKLNAATFMDPTSDDHHKLMSWVKILCSVPFGKNIAIAPPSDQISSFLKRTREILDREVYGHEETKHHMILTLAKWITNPDAPGIVLGICSDVGQGKSLLVKEGLSKALGLPCAFIPLGGANDSSMLDGHSFTYVGSTHGKIVDSLIRAHCMNPIMCFDELDKVADNSKGSEIFNVLIHITDSTQNDSFHDHYFEGIDFDLSKSIIVFTYNDETKVHPVLKDRMTCVNMKPYSRKDKICILKDYMFPKILETYKFAPGTVSLSDDAIDYVITEGLRHVKQTIETVVGNLNLERLTAPPAKNTITLEMVKKVMKKSTIPDEIAHIYL